VKIPGGQKIKLIQPKTIKEKGVIISTPTHDGLPRKAMFACLKEAIRFTAESGYRCMYNDVEGANIASNRINGVMEAKKSGAHWVMFIDSDMTFAPDDIVRLIDRNVDIVGGLCVKKAQPHAPTLYTAEEGGGFRHVLDFPLGELVECDASGAAFFCFPATEGQGKAHGRGYVLLYEGTGNGLQDICGYVGDNRASG